MTIQQLAQTLQSGDDNARLAAAQALATSDPATIGTAAVELVQGATDKTIADWCVTALEEMGTPPVDAVDRLRAILSSASSTTSADSAYWAATLLGRLGARAEAAVKDLAGCAAAGDAALHARERAVWALGKMSIAARPALPTLDRLVDSEHARLARLARQAVDAVRQ